MPGWTVPDPERPKVIAHDGLLWKPRAGGTATPDEFVAARSLFIDLTKDNRWNPRVLEDRVAEHDAAIAVMAQWTCTEPGFRRSRFSVQTVLAEVGAEFASRHEERERARRLRLPLFDQARYDARLALREQCSIMEHLIGERDLLARKVRFPLMDDKRRRDQIKEHKDRMPDVRTGIVTLQDKVGDTETVVDAQGDLPADRRADALDTFRFDRERKVRGLRAQQDELRSQLKHGGDRKLKDALRNTLAAVTGQLKFLLDIAPLTAGEMCGDCDLPAQHGWTSSGYGHLGGQGPCSAWPQWLARLRRFHDLILQAALQKTPPPQPQPLAVIASGLPIDDVLAQLAAIRQQHPDSRVRRGNRSRFEIWPA